MTVRRLFGTLAWSALIAGSSAGCGGGGGGGGGGAPGAPTTFQSLGEAAPIRPDIRTGASVPMVSLQDRLTHNYAFPATPGRSYTLEIDTQPSGMPILIQAAELTTSGAFSSLPQTVTTPYSTTLVATAESTIYVSVFDENQRNLTLSKLTVLADQQEPNTSSFTTIVHIAGDSFAGFSSIPENAVYNNLATTTDRQRLVSDLLNGVNTIWAPTGVQINVAGSGFRSLSNAQVQAVEPSLIQGGRTILDAGDMALNVPARRWGNLGIPASDPTFGRSIDVFLVQDGVSNGVLGFSAGIRLRGQGGIPEGAGLTHCLIFSLFDSGGTPETVGTLTKTLAHELGHFLSLMHTTETDFQPQSWGGQDDLTDTPFSTTAHDTNGNGVLDGGDSLQACPDFTNLMFPIAQSGGQTALTSEQGAAIRAYLAIRRH